MVIGLLLLHPPVCRPIKNHHLLIMLPQPSFASKIISFIKIAITTSAHIIVARFSSGLCSASVEKSSQSLPWVSPFLIISTVSELNVIMRLIMNMTVIMNMIVIIMRLILDKRLLPLEPGRQRPPGRGGAPVNRSIEAFTNKGGRRHKLRKCENYIPSGQN